MCSGYRRRSVLATHPPVPLPAEYPAEHPAEYSRTGGAAGRNEHAEALLELLEHRRDARVRAAERAAHLTSKTTGLQFICRRARVTWQPSARTRRGAPNRQEVKLSVRFAMKGRYFPAIKLMYFSAIKGMCFCNEGYVLRD